MLIPVWAAPCMQLGQEFDFVGAVVRVTDVREEGHKRVGIT